MARSILFCLFITTSSQLGAQQLDIKRAKKKVTAIQEDGLPAGWKRLGDDLFRVRFLMPHFSQYMYMQYDSEGSGDDPFGGGGSSASKPTLKSAQQALESVGIPFGELGSASFDASTSILTIISTANTIELVDVYAGSVMGSGPPVDIAVRLEIYEVTKLQALQLQESAESTRDHKPERDAALAAVRDGNAKLATTLSLIGSTGQRAKLGDAVDVLYPSRNLSEEEKKATKDEKSTGFDYNQVGTVMEIEPNLDADGQTISLNLAVEHHTGPAEMDAVIDGLAAPKFHSKSLQTNLKLLDGNYLLLATWTPTGKPEYADGEIVQVVFVTASLQQEHFDYGIITVEEEEE